MPDRRNPLNALQKATSIGADPLSRDNLTESVMPLDPDLLRSLGKPLSELLGMVLKPTTPGTGLPARLRFGGFDSKAGEATMYGARQGSESFNATPQQLDSLIHDGMVDLAQPPQKAVAAIRRTLNKLLGAPEDTGPTMTPDRLEQALQGIHDAVPTDPTTGMKIYNPPGGSRVTPDMADAALQRMVDNTPKGPSGQPITNPGGHLIDDLMDLPIMRGLKRPTK